jgi:hypothetical protein
MIDLLSLRVIPGNPELYGVLELTRLMYCVITIPQLIQTTD